MGQPTISSYFESDHERIVALLKAFRSAKRRNYEEATTFFLQFRESLQRHIIWEEEILFPLFERKTGLQGGSGPTRLMRIEHRMIESYINDLYDHVKLQNPETDEAERKLVDLLVAHNANEETLLYPEIDKSIEADERAHILRSLERLPEERLRNKGGSNRST